MGWPPLPLSAQHELRAEFDQQKPVSLRGIVTRFEWNNPHALLYLDVGTVNWAVEWASPLELRKAGWTRDALKVGDSVTVEGWLARDGSKLASGRTVTAGQWEEAGGRAGNRSSDPGARKIEANAALARWPPEVGRRARREGLLGESKRHQLLSRPRPATSGWTVTGCWRTRTEAGKVAPFQPWAKGLYEYRQRDAFEGRPYAQLPATGWSSHVSSGAWRAISRATRAAARLCDVGRRQPQLAADLPGRARVAAE